MAYKSWAIQIHNIIWAVFSAKHAMSKTLNIYNKFAYLWLSDRGSYASETIILAKALIMLYSINSCKMYFSMNYTTLTRIVQNIYVLWYNYKIAILKLITSKSQKYITYVFLTCVAYGIYFR